MNKIKFKNDVAIEIMRLSLQLNIKIQYIPYSW